MRKSNRKLTRMGKRRFLETAAKTGISAIGLASLSKEAVAEVDPGPNEVL
jgi:hypothetical protein